MGKTFEESDGLDNQLKKHIVKAVETSFPKDGKLEVVFTSLTGELLKPEPLSAKKLLHVGTIHAPAIYLAQKNASGIANHKNIVVTVERERMTIHVLMDDTDPHSHAVIGSLQLHPDFVKLGINNPEKKYTPTELAELLKLNRHLFVKMADNLDVVSKLKAFTAKVESDIEKSSDSRGNKKELRAQVVTSNIPSGFTLKLPIFKGEDFAEVDIELEVNEHLQISLFSYDANQIVEKTKNVIIDTQLQKIDEIFQGQVIIIEK